MCLSTALSPYAFKTARVYQVLASIFYCVSAARSFAAASLPFPVECPRRSTWRGRARAVEVYVLPSPAPFYPLWAPSRVASRWWRTVGHVLLTWQLRTLPSILAFVRRSTNVHTFFAVRASWLLVASSGRARVRRLFIYLAT